MRGTFIVDVLPILHCENMNTETEGATFSARVDAPTFISPEFAAVMKVEKGEVEENEISAGNKTNASGEHRQNAALSFNKPENKEQLEVASSIPNAEGPSVKQEDTNPSAGKATSSFNSPDFVAVVKVENKASEEDGTNKTGNPALVFECERFKRMGTSISRVNLILTDILSLDKCISSHASSKEPNTTILKEADAEEVEILVDTSAWGLCREDSNDSTVDHQEPQSSRASLVSSGPEFAHFSFESMVTSHSGKKSFSCTFCPATFSDRSNFKVHLRVHTKEKPYSCLYCPTKFAQSCALTRHVRIHTEEKPFSCTFCSVNFNCHSNLKSHLRTHTSEKKFACTYCPARFSRNTHLKCHLRTHTKEKPYVCMYCNAQFTEQSNLCRHLRTHTNEKPFACTSCSASFNEKSDLMRHLRVHTNERPFECDICSRKFSQKSNLKAHQKVHLMRK